jgi:hypothetical protein
LTKRSENAFIVPDYQREYVWTEKEVQQLLDDLDDQLSEISDRKYSSERFSSRQRKEHTQGMSVQQGATDYFVKKCFQLPPNAYEEARRGAYNPTYLYYTLGKLEIYKLRADYQKAKGANYSLREFHDAFVKQGGVPIKLIGR